MTSVATPNSIPTIESSFEDYADFDISLLQVDNENNPMSQIKSELSRSNSPDYIPTTVLSASWFNTQLQQQLDNNLIPNRQEGYNTNFPPSPTPSIEFKPIFNGIYNTQINSHLFPPSPPDSNGAPSPIDYHYSDIKITDIGSNFINSMSPSTLSNNSVDWNLMNTTNSKTIFSDQVSLQHTDIMLDTSKKNHPTIRECLQDTSFQRKNTQKPLEASFDDDNLECLVLEQIPKFIGNTCLTLGISPDPQKWNQDQVQTWIKFMLEQYATSPTPNIQHIFDEDGEQLSRLDQSDFTNRVKDGATLFALLEIWKKTHLQANQINVEMDDLSSWNMDLSYNDVTRESNQHESELNISSPSHQNYSAMDVLQTEPLKIGQEECQLDQPMVKSNQKLNESQPQKASADVSLIPATTTKSGQGRHGSAHIHLWQFLKELLEAPQKHGTAIRWIDRRNGVFKIEDSVRVARLWGQRKNRPAMNYDKLSRSIRQYYKKGIMQKTERSQRLVYQFCSPYIASLHSNF